MSSANQETLIASIKTLKQQKDAIIMAHDYQSPEVQEIADYIGDSLGLAQEGAKTSAKIILLAGVKFMAETAKILNPEKKVLIPDLSAGCSLADGCQAKEYSEFCKKYKDYVKVSYVNCSVEVKAMSDILCTSANAVKVINSIPTDKHILFGPDKNLGTYLIKKSGRDMLLWDGCCKVHAAFEADKIKELKRQHPQATVLVHPECPADVLELADYIGSTTGMIRYSEENDGDFIVVTETGVLHQMKKRSPNKKFYVPDNSVCDESGKATCLEMKKCNLENIYNCLMNEQPEILISDEMCAKAKISLMRMLAIK